MSRFVDDNKAFWFSVKTGSVGFVAHSLAELKLGFTEVPMKCLKFHMRKNRNDFETWIRNVIEDHETADKIGAIKERFDKGNLKGIALRKNLIKSVKV
jgi:hypothetical protein